MYDEEELTLIKEAALGNNDAATKIIIRNEGLVKSVALHYKTDTIELDDLMQEGRVGLYNAIFDFDPTRGTKFSTYATWKIRGEITDYISNYASTIRKPDYIERSVNRYNKKIERLAVSGSKFVPEEVAVDLGISIDKLKEIQQLALPMISLNKSFIDDNDAGLIDTIPDDVDFTNIVVNNMFIEYGMNVVLKKPERELIILYYGFCGEDQLSFEKIGKIFGITRAGVQQNHKRIIKKLQKNLVNNIDIKK